MIPAIYLLLIFVILFLELTRRKSAIIDFLTLFNLGYVVWYIVPGILIALEPNKALSGDWLNVVQYTNKIQTPLAIFLGYLIIFMGFYAKSAQKFAEKVKIESRNSKVVFFFVVFLLAFCLFCFYIYVSAFGGLMEAISQAIAVRSSTAEGEAVTGGSAIMIRFIGGTAFASYLLAGYVFTDVRKQDKFLQVILFAISVVGTICTFLVRAGRLDVIFYILGFYQIAVQKTKKVPVVFSLVFIFFAAIFIFYGKDFFGALGEIGNGYDAVERSFNERLAEDGKGDEGFNLYDLMSNFYYPLISLDVALGKNYELRWFVDLFEGFISVLPDRLLGGDPPKTILYYNSIYITGEFPYAIPTGLLAFGVYSLSWPGLIISCWVYGWAGGYLQTVFRRHLDAVFWMPFFYSIVSQNWVVMQSVDPESYFQSNFIFLVASFALLTLGARLYLVRDRS
jgi:sulfite exporter TauE/SafE